MDCYLPGNMIFIDAAGWSDLLLGVVVGAIRPPHQMLLERRIPTSSFQSPNFKNKKYLEDALKIADEIVTVMQPDAKTCCFKVGSEFVLSSIIERLEKRGFNVQKIESTGELKRLVDEAYLRWCAEKGVPKELLEDKKRFWVFLDWVAQSPQLREGLVKTGWDSWEQKWREEIYRKKPH